MKLEKAFQLKERERQRQQVLEEKERQMKRKNDSLVSQEHLKMFEKRMQQERVNIFVKKNLSKEAPYTYSPERHMATEERAYSVSTSKNSASFDDVRQ